jgi:hypothetical protein
MLYYTKVSWHRITNVYCIFYVSYNQMLMVSNL